MARKELVPVLSINFCQINSEKRTRSEPYSISEKNVAAPLLSPLYNDVDENCLLVMLPGTTMLLLAFGEEQTNNIIWHEGTRGSCWLN